MTIVTFKASRRASLVINCPAGVPPIDEFLRSQASHPALLVTDVFYPLDSEGPGIYKCRGWEVSVLWLTVLPVLTVRVLNDPDTPGILHMDVVGTDFTGNAADSINDSTELTSTNLVRWRTFEDSLGNDMLQITSKAEVEVLLALPSWFPVAPTILEAAGSQAVQMVLDRSLPRFLERVLDAYAWWAGIAGATTASSAWRRPRLGPGGSQRTGPVSGRTLDPPSPLEAKHALPQEVLTAVFEPTAVDEDEDETRTRSNPTETIPRDTSAPRVKRSESNGNGNDPRVVLRPEVLQEDQSWADAPGGNAEGELQSWAEVPEMEILEVEESGGEMEPEVADPGEKGKELWVKFEERKERLFVFEAVKTLVLPLREPLDPATGVPIFAADEYLSEPERLVRIVYNDPQFTRVADDRWVIKLIAINAFGWSVVPVYELVMSFENGRLFAQGGTVSLDPVNRPKMFDGMELTMRLNCITDLVRTTSRINSEGATCQLEARAELAIAAELPGMLKMVPGLKAIGDGILSAILSAVELAARSFLEKDYLKYVEKHKQEIEVQEASLEEPASK